LLRNASSPLATVLITGVIETYQAFRPELHLVDGDPYAYFNLPLSYSTLTCRNGAPGCPGYRAGAGLTASKGLSLWVGRGRSGIPLYLGGDLG
jgi:hypothetical protein